ncbi:dihydrodipicolinate synthase family protein [Prolixibacteraceae bacterium Z1-6]|uniref:Dihydrodipicolinate synthase family protein n=1 Tax=Draconibacterium aestuarii TaxID=2998507 RepID=A0A9X3J5W8_9BACT|nr:dihydrodipicolinate synthase family protein [Prolixibacteraceae bacterium Z1-6]
MELKEKYRGVIVPMVSPFKEDFSIDGEAINTIIKSFVENETKPFVLGTTGEAPSLSTAQKVELIKITLKALDGKQPLLAGIGSNSIFTSIEDGKRYADLGVDALVATVPNYYPSDAAQMLNWFEKLADSVPLPLFVYNIPMTTHHSIPLDVVETLSHHANIIGIKDSENDKARLEESLKRWKDRDDFMVLVGSAVLSVFGMSRGANGIVPSMGNLMPEIYHQLIIETVTGNLQKAEEIQELTNTISSYCQAGRNVSKSIPAMKALMSIKGICGTQVLPPMLRMKKEEEAAYIEQMQKAIENISVIK